MKRFEAEHVQKSSKSNSASIKVSTCVTVGGGGQFKACSTRVSRGC